LRAIIETTGLKARQSAQGIAVPDRSCFGDTHNVCVIEVEGAHHGGEQALKY